MSVVIFCLWSEITSSVIRVPGGHGMVSNTWLLLFLYSLTSTSMATYPLSCHFPPSHSVLPLLLCACVFLLHAAIWPNSLPSREGKQHSLFYLHFDNSTPGRIAFVLLFYSPKSCNSQCHSVPWQQFKSLTYLQIVFVQLIYSRYGIGISSIVGYKLFRDILYSFIFLFNCKYT